MYKSAQVLIDMPRGQSFNDLREIGKKYARTYRKIGNELAG